MKHFSSWCTFNERPGKHAPRERRKWWKAGEDCTVRSSITCMLNQILLEWSNQGGWDGRGMQHAWEMRNASSIVVGNPEGKRPLRKRTRRWEDNIRVDRREIGWEGMDRMHLTQKRDQRRRLVNTVTNLWVPYKVGNFLTSWVTIRFSRRALLQGVG